MEQDNTSLSLQFYNVMLRLKRSTRRLPPPCKEVSHFEFLCLNVIADYAEEHPELPGIKASILSERTHTSRPTTSQNINLLEEKGMIRRTASQTDRRVTYLCLTDRAKAFLIDHEAGFFRHIQQVTDLLGEEDTITMVALLEKLAGIMDSMARQAEEPKPQREKGISDS